MRSVWAKGKVLAGMALLVSAAFSVSTSCVSAQDAASPPATPHAATTPSRSAAAPSAIEKPASVSDTRGWLAYVGALVKQNLDGMTAHAPYAYFIPAGDSADNAGMRQRQLDNVRMIVARGILPGNLVAFAGPDSATTAAFVIHGFASQPPNSCKGVILVFVGEKADWQRVAEAWQSSGATLRFVDISLPPRPVRLPAAPAHAASVSAGGAGV
jgi:hypothetical protein